MKSHTHLVVLGLLLGACGDKEATTPVGSRSASGGSGGLGTGIAGAATLGLCSNPDVSVSDCNASELFDWSSVPVFDLALPAAAWAALKKNARDEQYSEAELTFEGHALGKVALRFKGSYGTLLNCFDSAGNQTCKKLSMKLKFNEYDPEGRFFGLKHVNLHSMIADGSQLHDRIAYRMYREMGVVAPRSSWATVRVNGETQGLYAMVEQIDGRFTADRWPAEGDGNLYKEASVGNVDASYYAEHLETNTTTATHDGFVGFSQAFNGAAPASRSAVLGQFTDLGYLANYMAVDDAICNWDGITGIYTDPKTGAQYAHNFYIYQEPTRAYFWLIPWDLDNTFSISNGFGLVPNWAQIPADCAKLIPVFGGQNYVTAPGCASLFQALATDRAPYQGAVTKLLAGPFAEQPTLAAIDRDAAFIANAVTADPLGPGAVSWAASVTQLKADIPKLRARLLRIAAGEIVVPLTLTTAAINDFEGSSAESAQSGPLMMVNPGSTGTQSINFTTPISGTRDLRVDFEYRNTAKAWDQWMYFSIPLTDGVADATAKSGLRLTVRSSVARTFRVELESPAQTATTLGIRVGWDVPATTETKTFELLFAEAKVPSWAVAQGTDPKDDLSKIQSTVAGLAFHPYCLKRNSLGFLPDGVTDAGWVEVDDIQFY